MTIASPMQEYGGGGSTKPGECREGAEGGRERSIPHQGDGYHASQYPVMQHNSYGCANQDFKDPNISTHCRLSTSIYEASGTNQQYQNPRYSLAPTFSSPPNSPLIGLVFDPSSVNYTGSGILSDRSIHSDRRCQNFWSTTNQEPIGTGAKKKIVESQEKRQSFSTDSRYHDRCKDDNRYDEERQRRYRNLNSESTSSLDFYVEGERMVSELCNITDSRSDGNVHKSNVSSNAEKDKSKSTMSCEALLTALDKIIIHDQIPNQIVQLAIEACTDAENIAIAHHNRPCFKNIHSICAKTRSNVQKPDSAVANLHSQGIPWVIKNFIFSFVRILDGWKGVKELLSEKHETFSRIENKYYSQNIRECFVQWQAVTKEMLTHIYKTFKRLDQGFTMEQKSFTHNYYATNSAAPRHQNQNKFPPPKSTVSAPRHVNISPQPYIAMQPPWVQNQTQMSTQTYSDVPWPNRSSVVYRKIPIVSPSNSLYPFNDPSEVDVFHKTQYTGDPCNTRETKPRQSWTITSAPDFRTIEGIDQKELYNQLKHKIDAELGKSSGYPIMGNMPTDMLHRKEMELKAKMIPLSHVEKSLLPNVVTASDTRGCYVQKNNSCGDTKEESDFFAAWGQMMHREPSDVISHRSLNIQKTSNVVTIPSNISGPVQLIDPDNDEYHEISKVYMKPGSYKVPFKPADPTVPFIQNNTLKDVVVSENQVIDDTGASKTQDTLPSVTLAPQPKYNMESWPCLTSRYAEDIFSEDHKILRSQGMSCLDMTTYGAIDLLNSMSSDRAWEAAKQSAPKLMDFIHEGSKSSTARLYDALGLCANDTYSENLKQTIFGVDDKDTWSNSTFSNIFNIKGIHHFCNQGVSVKDEQSLVNHESAHSLDTDKETQEIENEAQDNSDGKQENPRTLSFDQSGNYVKDDNQKKLPSKPKVAASGIWYHPKKKKPLPAGTVRKFENIIAKLSETSETAFIKHDMDLKMAPRFYEVVKYPMCLHDISTKMKSSLYTDTEQVVQDFKRIFNNVRLYLKSCPDSVMKKNITKISADFDRLLNDEFKCESRVKSSSNSEIQENSKKKDLESKKIATKLNDASKKSDNKNSADDKK